MRTYRVIQERYYRWVFEELAFGELIGEVLITPSDLAHIEIADAMTAKGYAG
jgi:hypothetical protein